MGSKSFGMFMDMGSASFGETGRFPSLRRWGDFGRVVFCRKYLSIDNTLFYMSDLFQNKYRIRSARATWWEYDDGIYFITICTKDKQHDFGEVIDEEMRYSLVGEKAVECISAIPLFYPQAVVVCSVVMPNHVHILLMLNSKGDEVEPTTDKKKKAKLLPSVIGAFKASVTRYAHQQGIPFAWQSRFHDHIVRNQDELSKISDYIRNNVHRWGEDRYHEPANDDRNCSR